MRNEDETVNGRGELMCTEPGVYDLTIACTRVVRAEVGHTSGIGWWWHSPGGFPNDDWGNVVGTTRVLGVKPEQSAGWADGVDLVSQLMERTSSLTPRLALFVVGRLLQRWHRQTNDIAQACESGDWSQVAGDGGSEVVAELMRLVAP